MLDLACYDNNCTSVVFRALENYRIVGVNTGFKTDRKPLVHRSSYRYFNLVCESSVRAEVLLALIVNIYIDLMTVWDVMFRTYVV